MAANTLEARNREQALLGRLGQVPLFARLSSRHLQLLCKVAKPRSLAAGEILCRADEADEGLYILLKGRLEVRRGGTVVGEVKPIGTAGEIGALTGAPQEIEIASAAEGLALHIAGDVMALMLSRDGSLYTRLARNVISWLSAELVRGNRDQAAVAGRRQELQQVIDEARHELNDARMLHSMRT